MKNNLKLIIIAFVAGICGAGFFNVIQSLYWSSEIKSNLVEEQGFYKTVKKDAESQISENIDFAQASAISTPSVVFIKTVSDAQYESFDFFDMYFGGGSRDRKVSGSGSGVIFTADGYIVTNYHVIEGSEKIEVVHQKKSYSATIVGTDPSADIAIVKIDAKNLPAIKRGTAREVKVGEWVIAVGNPFNLTSTVTAGIVSAKGRNIELLRGQFPLESFIQTDAAINPGNSGGALVNIKGELVGINTAILSRTGSYTGYGFAVPVDIVAKIFNDLIQYGEVQKAFTGLSVSDLNTELTKEFGLNLENFDGALVTDVQNGSEAEKLGLKSGDIVLKINGQNIDGKSAFDEQIGYYRPGEKVKITVKSGKQTKEVQITLTNREGTTAVLKSEIYNADKLGADLEAVSKIEKEKLGIENGVRIAKIKGRSIFSRMEEGFIITAINRIPMKTPEQVEKTLLEINRGRVYIEGVSKEGRKGYYSFYF